MGIDVVLQPYAHQVTGHASLMTTQDEAIIAKPVIANEVKFYLTMDSNLLPFTPHFYGVTDVTHRINKDEVTCTATLHLPSHTHHSSDVNMTSATSHHKSSIRYEGLERSSFQDQHGFQPSHWTQDKDKEADMSGVGRNPWAVRVMSKVEQNLRGEKRSIRKPCILIENVTRQFTAPCILDLKVGTRLHGVDCPTDKVLRHEEKNKLSTTSILGLRLAGFQVYQDSRFICRDKFYGRGLSADGFYNSLCIFLQHQLRLQVIDLILVKLERLLKVICSLPSYRLFGTSLIIMYEGACGVTDTTSRDETKHLESPSPPSGCCEEKKAPLVDVRLVDFAHCVKQDEMETDAGFLFGLKSLMRLLRKARTEEEPS